MNETKLVAANSHTPAFCLVTLLTYLSSSGYCSVAPCYPLKNFFVRGNLASGARESGPERGRYGRSSRLAAALVFSPVSLHPGRSNCKRRRGGGGNGGAREVAVD